MQSRFVIYIPTDTREATALSFAKVAGVPLLLRSILALAPAGETSFTIITPANHRRQLLKSWQRIVKDRSIHLNLILTRDGNKLSRDEIRELKGCVQSNFYFINANYVLPGIARLAQGGGGGNVQVFKPITKRLAVVGASTKHIDAIEPATVEDFLAQLASAKDRRYFTTGDDGIIVQKFSERSAAEHMLTEYIRKNTPMFIAREINKRISLPVSLVLARLRVSPNTITIVNIFIGLCAGIGAAGLTYTGVLLGAILFEIASIVDGCDGEVAKLTFRTSKFGQYIDSISDNLSLASFLTGMMIHQYRITDKINSFVWGGLLLIGVAGILAIMADYLKRRTNSASFVTYDKEFLQRLPADKTPKLILFLVKYLKILFKKDCFSTVFLLFAILGILHWWFYIITVGVWGAVAVLFYLRRSESALAH